MSPPIYCKAIDPRKSAWSSNDSSKLFPPRYQQQKQLNVISDSPRNSYYGNLPLAKNANDYVRSAGYRGSSLSMASSASTSCGSRKQMPPPGYTGYDSNPQCSIATTAKEKTEMCNTVQQGRYCAFGDRCKYAHNRSELKLTTVRERVNNKQISDGRTFRSRPCFDFTSTGACPFGTRCPNIHDENMKGNHSAYIKHCRYYQESIPTEVHVDFECTGKAAEIHYGDSLGPETEKMFQSYDSFTSVVCNRNKRKRVVNKSNLLSESQRLQIAKIMKASGNVGAIKYKPSHIVCANVCMIVQERTFRKKDATLMEDISNKPLHSFNRNDIFVVREIVFGHPSMTDVQHRPALWFNTPEEEIKLADLKTIKKYSKDSGKDKGKSLLGRHKEPPFQMFYSNNRDVQDFIVNVLHHQLRLSLFNGSDVLNEEQGLRERFASLAKVLESSHWPANKGRDVDNLDIQLPSVNGRYSVEGDTKNHSYFQGLWESAVINVNTDKSAYNNTTSRDNNQGQRLSVLASLSRGQASPVSGSNSVPLISPDKEGSAEPLPDDLNAGWDIVKEFWQRGFKGIRLDKK